MRATCPAPGKGPGDVSIACKRAVQAGSLGRELRAQSMLGEAPVADRLSAQVRGHARSGEMPQSQRSAARLPLHRLLGAREGRDRAVRNARLAAAVEAHGYTQQAIAAPWACISPPSVGSSEGREVNIIDLTPYSRRRRLDSIIV